MDLYRVYVQTDDHPHILEMIVAGGSVKDAKKKALGHVKESNPTKGRTLQTSQKNSTVLAAKKTGMHGALVVNKMPVTIYKEIMKNLKEDE
jgi:hypothetical protein